MATKVIPGDVLLENTDKKSGIGTYKRDNTIYSSIVGTVRILNYCCEVVSSNRKENVIPLVDAIVTGIVSKITQRYVKVRLVTVSGKVLTEVFSGLIRKIDVRSTNVDSVEMYECYRPGDIVRAKIISLGDSRSYYLTTAGVHFGVISAKSEMGESMVPLSWEKMKCPITGLVEKRKVAKLK